MTRVLLALAVVAAALAAPGSSASAPIPHIASVAIDGSYARVLSGDVPASTPIVAPDGRILHYRGPSQPYALWLMNADGTGARHLSPFPEGYGPVSWSPTGSTYATTGWDHSPCSYDSKNCAIAQILVHDAATGQVRGRVSSRDRGAYEYSWSPDGRRLALLGQLDYGLSAYTVEVAHVDGTGRRVLARSTFPNWFSEVAWSPRGDWIAYVRKGWIWLVRPSGDSPARVAKGTRLLWSPRGQLLYSADRTRRLLDPATKRSRPLVAAPAYIASWSPDGTRLVYRAKYDGVSTLAVARVPDGRVVSRVFVEAKVTSVHFSADGARLLYGAG